MKEIKLFVKFHFTSLSLDAQPISMAIVSDDMPIVDFPSEYPRDEFKGDTHHEFYAEFTDFDIDRCDDWVKYNVVSKLKYQVVGKVMLLNQGPDMSIGGSVDYVSECLDEWLSKFKDYRIQFVVDCSYLSSAWIIDLLDVRRHEPGIFLVPEDIIPKDKSYEDFLSDLKSGKGCVVLEDEPRVQLVSTYKRGLPIIPENVSPVTCDLNELIATIKKISINEAFNMDRRELALNPVLYEQQRFNALYDAKIIKTIYNNLR
jgi:hypothetical protein